MTGNWLRSKLGRAWILVALWLVHPAISRADGPVRLRGVDTYGSARWTTADVQHAFKEKLTAFADAMSRGNVDALRSIRGEILNAVRMRGPFPYAEVSPAQTAAPESGLYVTVDIVEQRDAKRRMPFRKAPSRRFSDPAGLVARWKQFEDLAFPLAMAGKMQSDPHCPVLHCLFSFDAPELAPFLPEFNDGVNKHKALLLTMAAQDVDPEHRKSAVYLLAHTNDLAAVVGVSKKAIYDPSPSVRNAAMRILMTTIAKYPDFQFPIDDLLVALDFPATSDRNKAAWSIARLAEHPKYREVIRARAVPTLLRLLRLQQPINHDPAYEILKLVSGKAFSDRDYLAWEDWAASTAAAP